MAAAAGAGAYLLHSRDIPDDLLFFRSIVWYSTGAAVLCAVHAVAVLLVRRFPTARTATLDGRPAVLLRAWRGTWWLTSALDLGLLVVTGSWVHLAWTTSADRVFMTALAALPFLWFVGRWTTRALGHCRPEALWVTDQEVVHDSERGRARLARADVVEVLGWDDADGAGTDVLTLRTSTEPQRSFGPRLLTLSRRPGSPTRTSVQTTLMGHPAPEIAAWLQGRSS
jgi:hypothetical protein